MKGKAIAGILVFLLLAIMLSLPFSYAVASKTSSIKTTILCDTACLAECGGVCTESGGDMQAYTYVFACKGKEKDSEPHEGVFGGGDCGRTKCPDDYPIEGECDCDGWGWEKCVRKCYEKKITDCVPKPYKCDSKTGECKETPYKCFNGENGILQAWKSASCQMTTVTMPKTYCCTPNPAGTPTITPTSDPAATPATTSTSTPAPISDATVMPTSTPTETPTPIATYAIIATPIPDLCPGKNNGEDCTLASGNNGICCSSACSEKQKGCLGAYYGEGTYNLKTYEKVEMNGYVFKLLDVAPALVKTGVAKKGEDNFENNIHFLDVGTESSFQTEGVGILAISVDRTVPGGKAEMTFTKIAQATQKGTGATTATATPTTAPGGMPTPAPTSDAGQVLNEVGIDLSVPVCCKDGAYSPVCYNNVTYRNYCEASCEAQKNGTENIHPYGKSCEKMRNDGITKDAIDRANSEPSVQPSEEKQCTGYAKGCNIVASGCCSGYHCAFNLGMFNTVCVQNDEKSNDMIVETVIKPAPVDPYKTTQISSTTNSRNGLTSVNCTAPDLSGCNCTVNALDPKKFDCTVLPLAEGNFSLELNSPGETGTAILEMEKGALAKIYNLGKTEKLSDDTPILFLGFTIIIVAISILIYTKYGRETPLERKDRKELEMMKENCENELKLIKYRYMKREIDDMTYKNLSQQVEERKSELMSHLAKFEKKGEKKN